MYDRVSPSLAAGLVALSALSFIGCSDNVVKSNCTVQSTELTVTPQPDPKSTPLMLLSDARLDAVGDGFALLGSEGSRVRWAMLGRDGTITGDEHAIDIPSHAAGPWFAVAGLNAPADHLVIAYLPLDSPDTTPFGERPLMTLSVSIDNTDDVEAVSSGSIPLASEVVMRSGRGGMHAGFAWARHGETMVSARLLGGDGLPIGDDLLLGAVSDTIAGCLRFSGGKGDLTVGFIDASTTGSPLFVGTEIAEDGTVTNPLRLRLGKGAPGCVDLVSSDTGYGVVWHSGGVGNGGVGTYFGTYDPSRAGFPTAQVVSDVRIEGTVPAEAGLGWLGTQFAVVFARPTAAEVWPIDAMGGRLGVLPVLPSATGHMGVLSSQAVGSVLYTTYADYARASDVRAGSRLLVKVSCP